MLEVAFQLVAPLAEGEPSSEFIQGIKGEIRNTELDLNLGMISALLVQVGRVADAGENLFDVMDGASAELGACPRIIQLCGFRSNRVGR